MRIDAFLEQSPMFAIQRAARRVETLTATSLAAYPPAVPDSLSFLEGLVLAAIFFEAPQPVKPSHLAETFATTRANISHCLSSLEGKGFLLRRIDPEDARAYLLSLKPQGKRHAIRVIGAFDRLQKECEDTLGKTALKQMLGSLRRLEALGQ